MSKISDLYVVAGIYAIGLYAFYQESEAKEENNDKKDSFALKDESLILLFCTLVAGD